MRTAALALIGLVALLHFGFLVLEMFLWRTRARRLFRMSAEKAETTAQLAANQGLYNGFLATGLVWALLSGPEQLVPGRRSSSSASSPPGSTGRSRSSAPSSTCRRRRPRSRCSSCG